MERKAIINIIEFVCKEPVTVTLYPVDEDPKTFRGFRRYFKRKDDAIAFANKYAEHVMFTENYDRLCKYCP